jgi:hypothetical protein
MALVGASILMNLLTWWVTRRTERDTVSFSFLVLVDGGTVGGFLLMLNIESSKVGESRGCKEGGSGTGGCGDSFG